jgi:hypothetical protein
MWCIPPVELQHNSLVISFTRNNLQFFAAAASSSNFLIVFFCSFNSGYHVLLYIKEFDNKEMICSISKINRLSITLIVVTEKVNYLCLKIAGKGDQVSEGTCNRPYLQY